MGSAASTANHPPSKSEEQSIADDPRQGPCELSISPILDDDTKQSDAADGNPGGLSANRLKKLALGIPGYKDQQRDYDPTLAKLELNKTTEMLWKDPSPDSRRLVSGSNRHGHSTHSIEAVDSSSSRGPDSPYSNLSSHSGSFVRPPPQATPGRLPPGRPMPTPQAPGAISGPPPGIVARPFPRKDESDSMMATFTGGGGGGGNHHGRSGHDLDPHQSQRPRPESIPVLPLNSAAPGMQPRRSMPQIISSSSPQPTSTPLYSPPPGSVHHVGVGTPMQVGPTGAALSHVNSQRAPNAMNALSATGGPITTLPGGAVVVGGNLPRVGPPPPLNHAHNSPHPVGVGVGVGVGGPRGTPVSTPSPATTPTLPSTGPVIPVVKETKNVKRNRAQLPDKLTHAKPTTGDWLNKRYIVNNYILLETLGTGSYGEVRLCKDRTNEKLFAIKIISKDFLRKKKGGKSDETYFEDIKREIAIMKKLLHPNILRLFEVLDDPKVNKIYLLLEYVKMGDLIHILKKRGEMQAGLLPKDGSKTGDEAFTPLSDLEVWNILRQLVAGIRYLHFQNIVHGDIKPQNLLLGEDGILKVADFGISQMLSGSEQTLLDAGGTPAFMAPELCEKRSFSGQAADIWAMGATIYMLRFGHPPFQAKNIIHLFAKICNDPLVIPATCEAGLRGLLEQMLDKDPARRITMPALASHPWLRVPPPVSPRSGPGGGRRAVTAAASASAAAGGRGAATAAPPQAGQPGSAGRGSAAGAAGGAGRPRSGTPSAAGPGGAAAAAAAAGGGGGGGAAGESVLFQPPESYAAEEERAARERIAEVDGEDLFASIGGIRARTVEEDDGEEDGEEIDVDDADLDSDDDDDDDQPGEEKAASRPAARETTPSAPSLSMATGGTDMLQTQWGADVFQLVADELDDDDDVDDDDDDDDEAPSHAPPPSSSSAAAAAAPTASSSGAAAGRSRLMSEEEQSRRSRQFLKKSRRSAENVHEYTEPASTADLLSTLLPSPSASSRQPAGSTGSSKTSPSKGFFKPGSSGRAGTVAGTGTTGTATREGSRRLSLLSSRDDEDEPEAVTGEEDLAQLMDTLSQQQVQHALQQQQHQQQQQQQHHAVSLHGPPSHVAATATGGALASIEEEEEAQDLVEVLRKLQTPVRNSRTGLGAAFYSEQGLRPSQEDRCVLLPAATQLKALQHRVYRSEDEREALACMGVAAVFDGHNGARSSHFLASRLVAHLVSHDLFLDPKRLDEAILDTFRRIDFQLCELLQREEDASGSTAVVAVFDGRRQRLTVAGVGDSLCVLSRNGRAVSLNPMHRLDLDAERDRIRAAGGSVINHRVNGILAVSRAFGDVQFKAPLPSPRANNNNNSSGLRTNSVGNNNSTIAREGGGVSSTIAREGGSSIIAREAAGEGEGEEEGGVSGGLDGWRDGEGLVVSRPSLSVECVTGRTEFAVLASDGLWDVLSPQAAVTFVRHRLRLSLDLQAAAKDLVREALARGSVDNVTVGLLSFAPH